MKHSWIKRSLALLLVFTLSLNLIPVNALASETDPEGDQAVSSGMDVAVEGTNDVGDLIASTLSEVQEEYAQDENYITDLVVEDQTAQVSYEASGADANVDVVVAIYEESSGQMTASGSVTVDRTSHSCTIQLEGSMPEYFLAKAYLLESDTHQPISPEFTCQVYTKEMQDFLAMTTDDFDEELVVNLDEDKTNNYMVFNEDTILIEEESGVNQITDHGDGTYTIENADSTFLNLSVGDSLAYFCDDGSILIINVAAISISGTTVEITDNEDIEIEDVFDYVKIDTDTTDAVVEIDNSYLDDGITYLGEGYLYDADEPATTAIDWNGKGKISGSYSVNVSDKKENWSYSVKGTVSVGLTADFKVYVSMKQKYLSFAVKYSAGFDVAFEGKTDLLSYSFNGINIYVLGGFVDLCFVPSLVVRFDSTITFKTEFTGTFGVAYDNDYGVENLSECPELDLELKYKGALYIGIEFKPTIKFIVEKIANVSVSAAAGAELAMSTTIEKVVIGGSASYKKHACEDCVSGTVTAKFKFAAEGQILFGEKLTASKEFDVKLTDLYYSVTFNEVGLGTCPHISFQSVLTFLDKEKVPVKDAQVLLYEGGSWDTQTAAEGVTDENGEVEFYLQSGTYMLMVFVDDNSESLDNYELIVRDNKKLAKFTLTDYAVGQETETETETETESETEKATETETEPAGDVLASGFCGDDVTWALYKDGTLRIQGSGPMYDYEEWESPFFDYTDEIISVVIESGVTSVGDYAFTDCDSISTAAIPDTVATLGDFAFDYCVDMTGITLSEGLTKIGDYVFRECVDLEDIVIPSTVTSIGEGAFQYCESLPAMEIPEGVSCIEERTFEGCESMPGITIPVSVTSIGSRAFYNCDSLKDVYYAGDASQWDEISIGGNNSCLTGANIHYNGVNATSAPVPESEETVYEYEIEIDLTGDGIPAGEANPDTFYVEEGAVDNDQGDLIIDDTIDSMEETAPEETGTIDLPETVPEGSQEELPEESQPEESLSLEDEEDLLIDTAQLMRNAAVKTMMAYPAASRGSGSGEQTATFNGLVAGEAYVLLVTKDAAASNLLSSDNLLYIAQADADASGNLTFTYYPREASDNAAVYVYGASGWNLSDAEITLEAESFAYSGIQIKPLVEVVYGGNELTEYTDYTVSYADNISPGTATVIITGRGDYAGTVQLHFTIEEEETESEKATEKGTEKETEHQHTPGSWTVTKAATCTESGTQVQKCTTCGATLSTKTIAATGHSFGSWKTKTAATVFDAETQTRTCSKCKTTETKTVGKKLTPTITVNVKSIKLQVKQFTTALKVTGLANGDSIKSWKSSNTKIVKVSKKGKITAKNKTGKATITITLASGLKQKIKVTVQKKPVQTTKVSLSSKKFTVKKGKTYDLSKYVTVTPITSQDKVTYSTSNKKVVSVNAKGKIKAKKKGSAVITVTSGSKSVKCMIKVK